MAVPLEQEVAVRCCSWVYERFKNSDINFAHSADMSDGKTVLHSKEVLNLKSTHISISKTKLPYFIVTERTVEDVLLANDFTNALKSIYDLNYELLFL
jgi:hypothetical protein